jgi:dTDP-4-amino-4,6-dideoxygalactose transaminase
MSQLALFGGDPIRKQPFPPHPVIGDEEKRAVMKVLDGGALSGFLAVPGDAFLGGEQVREFERRVADYHGVEFAVAFNSATSALHAAVVAVGVEPGDEVIATPYTFTASAACVLMHNAIPVFADVQDSVYGLDPDSVAARITPLTKAIIPVHLFGHPADMDGLMRVAREHGLKVIEDAAQSPGARYKGQLTGTIGDCGVFSFTENKNLATGEGGMLITDDPAIAEAARLVRNHGEAVWNPDRPATYGSSILGWNYRMTEIEAALGIAQFDKIDALNNTRIKLCDYLTDRLAGIDGLTPPVVKPDCRHVYYIYALAYDAEKTGIPRDQFIRAMNAEGIPMGAGYIAPLYLGPIYHERKAPAFRHYTGTATYERGLCPVVERLHERDLVLTLVARAPARTDDMDDIVRAVEKIMAYPGELTQAA